MVVAGLRGLDPDSELRLTKKTLLLLALSIVTCLRKPQSHLKQYGLVLEPSFRTLREIWNDVGTLRSQTDLPSDNPTDKPLKDIFRSVMQIIMHMLTHRS